jgi:hypothetical protein
MTLLGDFSFNNYIIERKKRKGGNAYLFPPNESMKKMVGETGF